MKNIIFQAALLSLCCCAPKMSTSNVSTPSDNAITQNDIIVEAPTVNKLKFGYGGGVAGKVHSYTLEADGRLYKGDELLDSLAQNIVDSVFQEAGNFVNYDYKHPNNLYSFMEIYTADAKNYIVWNAAVSKNVDTRLVVLHQYLKSLAISLSSK